MKTPKLSDIITAKDSSQVSLDDLRQQVQGLAAADDRFKVTAENNQCVSGPWVDNILFDDGEWSAIVCNAGKLWEVGFEVEDGKVTELSDEAKEVKRKTAYVEASEPFKFNGKSVKDADGEICKAVGIPTLEKTADSEVAYCKDSGSPLPVEKKWEFGKPVEFMWAPGGKTVITAGCAGRSLRLWVIGDEAGAKSVQSSFVSAVAASPRRLPYGCIEHEEKERAFEPKRFAWKNEPEPGIYCSAVPTKLGEANVNGKLQTSFSPCFRHDARLSTAVCTECEESSSVCKCDGVLAFPDGVRGSESNPAHIVGVFEKSVGSLTNWPAFKDILPVTAKEPDQKTNLAKASGTSEGVKKAWETREGYSSQYAREHTKRADEKAWSVFGKESKGQKATPEELHDVGMIHSDAGSVHLRAALNAYKQGDNEGGKSHMEQSAHHYKEANHHFKRVSQHYEENPVTKGVEKEKPSLDSIYAKAGVGIPTDETVKATWSDAAREAAKEARSKKADSFHMDEGMKFKKGHASREAHLQSAFAYHTGSEIEHKEAARLHSTARNSALDSGHAELAQEHEEHRAVHLTHAASAKKTSASEKSKPSIETIYAKVPDRPAKPTLESIYAKSGANRTTAPA